MSELCKVWNVAMQDVHKWGIYWLIWLDSWCFNATFSSISAISWRPVLVVEEAGENHLSPFLHYIVIRYDWNYSNSNIGNYKYFI